MQSSQATSSRCRRASRRLVFRGAAVLSMLSVVYVNGVLAAGPAVFRHQIVDDSGPEQMHVKSVGDVNGDGAVDLIVAGVGGELVWYESPTWMKHVVCEPGSGGWSTDAETADIDRDGDADIVISDWYDNHRLVWFENLKGNGRSWQLHRIGDVRAHDIELADLDGDGDLDLITRQQDRDGQVLEIWLQQDVWTWKHRQVPCPVGEGIDVADLDADGRPDLVIAARWYKTPDNPATDAWTEYTYTKGWTHAACVVATADVNADGRLDVVLTPAEKSGGTGRIAWFEAPVDATQPLWEEHVIDLEVETVIHSLAVGDMNGDGRVDVVCAEMHQSADPDELTVYYNEGDGRSWTPDVVADTGSHAIRVIDVGSDGDLDIFGANWTESTQVDLWINTSAPEVSRVGVHSLDRWTYIRANSSREGRAFGLASDDFDRDGYQDIVSGRYFYRNPGADMASPWQATELPGNVDALLTLDIDGDVLPDVVAMDQEGGVYWLEAEDSEVREWRVHSIGETGEADHNLSSQGYATAQLVGGGRPEIILNANGLHCFVIPEFPLRDSWQKLTIATDAYPEGVDTVDFDADGDIDVCGAQDDHTVAWWENPGTDDANWVRHTVGALPSKYVDRFAAADVNRDGLVDIVVSAANGGASGLYWWERMAPDSDPWQLHTIVAQDSTNSMDVLDIDGDGDVDIVAGEHRGAKKVAIWENDGAGHFVEHVVSTGIESHLGTRAIDLDNDGDFDLVSIAWDKPQDLHIWRNDARKPAKSTNEFTLFDEEILQSGDRRLYDDWDFQVNRPFHQNTPSNWLEPIDYATGTYHIRCQVIQMEPVDKPIHLGFGWINLPRDEDPTVQHRAGHPINVTGPGVYHFTQPVAKDWHGPGDSSNATKPWRWASALKPDSFFTFIRPDGQDPFPVRFRLTIRVTTQGD